MFDEEDSKETRGRTILAPTWDPKVLRNDEILAKQNLPLLDLIVEASLKQLRKQFEDAKIDSCISN